MSIKNTIVYSFFLLILILFFQSSVYAQTPSPAPAAGGVISIPGVTCGNSGAQDPIARLCCKKQTIIGGSSDIFIVSGIENAAESLRNNTALQSIPILGGLIDVIYNIRSATLQLDQTTTPIACPLGFPSTQDPNDPSCTCLDAITPSPINKLKEMCTKYLAGSSDAGQCQSCADASGVWTGLGCIYGDAGRFIRETIFGFAVGLAGVVALICIIYAVFTLQTSRGNPEKVKKAQELLTSCIMGLMLILFSVFILRLIGVNILRIPGFG